MLRMPGLKIRIRNQLAASTCSIWGLWFMVFNATSKIFQLYHGGQFYWWTKLEYPEKTINIQF